MVVAKNVTTIYIWNYIINPTLDTAIRIVMNFKGLEKPINVEEQKLNSKFECETKLIKMVNFVSHIYI